MNCTTINPILRYTRMRQVISLCQYPFHNTLEPDSDFIATSLHHGTVPVDACFIVVPVAC
jgi:hypothetical protein